MTKSANNLWTQKRCLVTGGYGFGGSHLCEQLLEKGAQCIFLTVRPLKVHIWCYAV